MGNVQCEGWWEQHGFGRQPMEDLTITHSSGRVQGTGVDIVGPFRLDGNITEDRVTIVKQYLGQHHVEYHGVADGEGTWFGQWGWGGVLGGRWLIRFSRRQANSEAITDITRDLIAESSSLE